MPKTHWSQQREKIDPDRRRATYQATIAVHYRSPMRTVKNIELVTLEVLEFSPDDWEESPSKPMRILKKEENVSEVCSNLFHLDLPEAAIIIATEEWMHVDKSRAKEMATLAGSDPTIVDYFTCTNPVIILGTLVAAAVDVNRDHARDALMSGDFTQVARLIKAFEQHDRE